MEDYTALIKTLRYLATEIPCPDCPLAEECPGIESCCFGHAARVIEELSSRKWISTKEQLPETLKPVIVARPCNKSETMRVEQGYLQPNGWWKVYGTNVKRVCYWMPIPEPPEED